jgi:hypothetical protein
LREQQTKLVSARLVALASEVPKAAHSVIVRDPDGHALQFIQKSNSLAEK